MVCNNRIKVFLLESKKQEHNANKRLFKPLDWLPDHFQARSFFRAHGKLPSLKNDCYTPE